MEVALITLLLIRFKRAVEEAKFLSVSDVFAGEWDVETRSTVI